MAALAREAGVPVNVSLSCCFGCPMEGEVPASTVLDWCERFVDELGAQGVTLCDTTGMAYPPQVQALADGDGRKAERLARQHIEQAADFMIDRLQREKASA